MSNFEIGILTFICHLSFVICHFKMSKQKLRHKYGFTLVETIVSLGILLMGIGASLTLMTSAIAFSRQTEDIVVVMNLAREGLELVRGLRDTNGYGTLTEGSWVTDRNSTSLSVAASFSGGSGITACINCGLHLNNGQYLTTPGTPTPYARYIEITDISPSEKQVSSYMRWTEHGRTHTYTLNTVLTDWQ